MDSAKPAPLSSAPKHWLALFLCPPRAMRLFALLLAVTLVALLFYLGARPFASGVFDHPYDKMVHFGFYGGLAGIFWIMLGGYRGYADWGALLLGFGVGLADELVQMYNPLRYASMADLVCDLIGIAVAVITLSVARKRLLRPSL